VSSGATDPVAEGAPSPADAPRLFAHGNRPLLVGLVSVILLIAFEAMAVATAMPRAVAELHGQPYYAWAFSGFVVTSLFAMVVAGEVCDARGPMRPMVVGVGLFTAGLLVAGTAVDMAVFVAARALQGLGCGAVIVAVYVVVGRAFDDRLRPQVFSLLSAAWVLPSVVGPSVAGFLADQASWRWVFLGVSVLVIAPLLLMLPSLPRLEGGQPVTATGRKRAALAVAVGLGCLQYAGQRLDRVGLAFAVAGVLLVVPTVRRLLPAGTLRFARGLPTVIAMRGVLAGSFFGAETFIPLMLVTERGLTSTQAGLSLTGAALGWASGSWYQGRPSTRMPRHLLVRTGCTLVAIAIGVVGLTTWTVVPPWTAAVAWTVGGVGMGLAMASVAVLTLQLSPPQDQGANSAALQVSDSLFSAVTIGVGGAVYALGLRHDDGAWALRLIYLVMVGIAVLGVLVAGRVRPAHTRGFRAEPPSVTPAGTTVGDQPA
jgi:MFS family permease